MKRPARHALTIALVATALCADRAVANAPSLRPQVATGNLVARLSVSFRRVVPSVRVVEVRREDQVQASMVIEADDHSTAGHVTRLLPQLLRLPPPLA